MMKLVVLSLALATGSATFFTNQTEVQKVMFTNFKKEHGRVYESVAEEAKRFEIFVENLKIIDERNAAEAAVGGSGQHGINKVGRLPSSHPLIPEKNPGFPRQLKNIYFGMLPSQDSLSNFLALPRFLIQFGLQFTDVSQDEFKARYLTTVVPEELLKKPKLSLKPVELGASADWTGTYTTPVKDQG